MTLGSSSRNIFKMKKNSHPVKDDRLYHYNPMHFLKFTTATFMSVTANHIGCVAFRLFYWILGFILRHLAHDDLINVQPSLSSISWQ